MPSKYVLYFLLLTLSVACTSRQALHVRRCAISKDERASLFAQTPDITPSEVGGERFIVWWKSPVQQIAITILFGSLKEQTFFQKTEKSEGHFTLTIPPELVRSEKGILTYKVEAIDKSGAVIAEETDALWFTLIKPRQ